MNRNDIVNKLRSLKPQLAQGAHVKSIAVFGSAARDQLGPASDIDIVIEFDKTPGFFDLSKLEDQLSAELGRTVDLFTPASLHPLLRDRILKEAVYA